MKEYLSLIILYGVIQATISQNPCILKNAADITSNNPAGFVCVCNSTYCDDLPQLNNLQNNNVAIYRSSLSGQRFYTEQYNLTTASANSNDTVITIDSSIKYQQIHGFGGAFTGTASYNIMKLAYGSRINLMNSYFGQTGNGYTTCRVTLAASDFSIKGYSYDDSPGDFNLTNFKLDELEDIAYKIPAIQMAQSFAGNNLKLFGSPWSPPAWMKNNTNISGQADGVIMGSFMGSDSAYWNTYANYFYRFFEEHAKYNIKFWGLTIQNEPYNGMTPGMILVPEKERDFIKYFLGPKLKSHALTRDLKIMIWDFNRNNAENYTDTVLADPAAASYVDGIAIHWYDDVQYGINYTVPEHIHAKHPDKWIMNTEACAGWMGKPNDIKGVTLGNWSRGELYAHDILDNLNHWSTGWVDWNMVLNMTGGPLWQANPVDAPIIVADDNVTFYKQPMFYVLGHFSKFVIPGSYRIDSKWSSTSDKLEGATFITPTNQIVVVLHNRDPSQNYSITINDVQNPCKNAKLTIESKSIVTLIWNKATDCSSNVQSSQSPSNTGFSLKIGANHSVYVVLLIVFFVFRNF